MWSFLSAVPPRAPQNSGRLAVLQLTQLVDGKGLPPKLTGPLFGEDPVGEMPLWVGSPSMCQHSSVTHGFQIQVSVPIERLL